MAVAAFLAGSIAYDRIPVLIQDAVARWGSDEDPSLETIGALDAEIRTTMAAELRLSGIA